MNWIIEYFSRKPVVANVVMFGVIFVGIMTWSQVGKEEMPEFAMNWIRISVPYPGASAEDVELFITKPLEEKLKGVSALEEVKSTSSYGSSSVTVSFEPNIDDLKEKIQEVKDAVDTVEFPSEADDPVYRQFRSSEKAIIDVGMYLKDQDLLDVASRQLLQKYALAFKERVITLPEISGVDSSGYLRPELQIKAHPDKLKNFEISMDQIQAQVVGQHIRRPIGSMKDKGETDVTLAGELDTVERLNDVVVSSGFKGQKLKLVDVAKVESGFERSNQVIKVQGREGIVFNIKKSSNTDILSAEKALSNFVQKFQKDLGDPNLGFVMMDDESYDVRNRISLIASNGIIGFILIILVLFFFLDLKSGIWVGMGIPFCLAVTLVLVHLMGYTVNNITLSAIIIVLGIVVDDAIIVAENISRRQMSGDVDSSVKGVSEVFSPVIASVLTTCAAFMPLYFFEGRFGMLVKYIPVVVCLMLFASLVESFFILPAHMREPLPWGRFVNGKNIGGRFEAWRTKFVMGLEVSYSAFLKKVLPYRVVVLFGFAGLLLASVFVFQSQMRFAMFPREESKDFRVKVVVPEGTVRYETAKKMTEVEKVFMDDPNGVVIGVRSAVGQSRRGGQVRDNEGSIVVEVVPYDERELSLNQLFEQWQRKIDQLQGFEEVRLMKSRFGSDSGSPIAIEVHENDDRIRNQVAEDLQRRLAELSQLANVELEKPVTKDEYQLVVDKEEVSRLGVDFTQLATTLRAYVEGNILYTLNSGDEEVDVRFTSDDLSKQRIESIMNLTVSNQSGYLIPIKNLIQPVLGKKPSNIERTDYKRTIGIYADMAPGSDVTPLEVARIIEDNVFPEVTKGRPTVRLNFKGEILDSRESQADFGFSIAMALAAIYVLLVFLFNSVWTPFLIGAILPFGFVGVILAFWSHGMSQYGFFGVIGTIGMLGVVINDSIVLIDKLELSLPKVGMPISAMLDRIAEISATRLRAIIVTTVTTVAGLFPTAYGIAGYDAMLAEMMLAMCWGLLFGMFITLLLVPVLYSFYVQLTSRRGQHA